MILLSLFAYTGGLSPELPHGKPGWSAGYRRAHRFNRARRAKRLARTNSKVQLPSLATAGFENRAPGSPGSRVATTLVGRGNPRPDASSESTSTTNTGEIPSLPVASLSSPFGREDQGLGTSAPIADAKPSPQAVPAAIAAEKSLPKGFEGCWQGTVSQRDSWEEVEGPILKGWAPANYTLCLHRSGNSPEITFSRETAYLYTSEWVSPQTGLSDTHTEILFSSEDFIVLRAFGKLVLRNRILGFLPGPTALVSSQTDFHCYLRGDKLLVEGSTVERCSDARTVGCSGKTWIRESWHTEFGKQSP
jgi:hypothetical protein